MSQKRGKKDNWLWTLLMVENLVILIVIGVFAFKGCIDYGVDLLSTPQTVSMVVHAYPDKLIYVVGEDDALDLTGGEICFHYLFYHTDGFPCAELQSYDCDVVDMAELDHVSDIDFTKPGIYMVRFYWKNSSYSMQCAFPVQVVAPDYLE